MLLFVFWLLALIKIIYPWSLIFVANIVLKAQRSCDMNIDNVTLMGIEIFVYLYVVEECSTPIDQFVGATE